MSLDMWMYLYVTSVWCLCVCLFIYFNECLSVSLLLSASVCDCMLKSACRCLFVNVYMSTSLFLSVPLLSCLCVLNPPRYDQFTELPLVLVPIVIIFLSNYTFTKTWTRSFILGWKVFRNWLIFVYLLTNAPQLE